MGKITGFLEYDRQTDPAEQPLDRIEHWKEFHPRLSEADRRLLMHKREILRLFARIKQDGYSLIPLSIYFRGSRVKLELGLAKGKKLYDKRDSAAARDAKREMDRAIKSRNR